MARNKQTKPASATCAHCGTEHALTLAGVLIGHINATTKDWCLGSHERSLPNRATLGVLAWDLSDAFAKTADDHHFDFGLDEIEQALPQIIAVIQAAAARARATETRA